jgi:hypothetical protein
MENKETKIETGDKIIDQLITNLIKNLYSANCLSSGLQIKEERLKASVSVSKAITEMIKSKLC